MTYRLCIADRLRNRAMIARWDFDILITVFWVDLDSVAIVEGRVVVLN